MAYADDSITTGLKIEKPNLPSISEVSLQYKEKIDSLKKDKSWMRWVIGGGVALGSIFLASLAAGQIISGAVALIVAGVTVVGGYYGYKLIKTFDPVIQKKIQNSKMKALIEEAQKNKIETLTSYVTYLDEYLKYTKKLRIKVNALMDKYKAKLHEAEDKMLQQEYMKLVDKLSTTQQAIEKIILNSTEKKKDFERMLKIAREKYDFIKETKDIVDFLQNSDNEIDKILVDEGINQLEKEFLEISNTIESIAHDIED